MYVRRGDESYQPVELWDDDTAVDVHAPVPQDVPAPRRTRRMTRPYPIVTPATPVLRVA